MGANRFSCPSCKQTLRMKTEMQGQVVACPACKVRIHLPESTPGVILEIESKARAGIVLGIVAFLALGAAVTLALGGSGGREDRRLSAMGRPVEGQQQRLTREALVFAGALVGVALGLFAMRRGKESLRLIDENGMGDEYTGNATAAKNIGFGAVVANVALLLLMLLGVFGQ